MVVIVTIIILQVVVSSINNSNITVAEMLPLDPKIMTTTMQQQVVADMRVYLELWVEYLVHKLLPRHLLLLVAVVVAVVITWPH
jgi:hypothetical protein